MNRSDTSSRRTLFIQIGAMISNKQLGFYLVIVMLSSLTGHIAAATNIVYLTAHFPCSRYFLPILDPYGIAEHFETLPR